MSLSATSFVVDANPAAPVMGLVRAASACLRDIVVSPVVAGVGVMGVMAVSRIVGVSPPLAARRSPPQSPPQSPPLSPPLAPPRG